MTTPNDAAPRVRDKRLTKHPGNVDRHELESAWLDLRDARARLAEVTAERDALRKWLDEHGVHVGRCPDDDGDCHCGLAELSTQPPAQEDR